MGDQVATLQQSSNCGRSCGQFCFLLLALIAIALISFSLHHDRIWNEWVDSQFNLNKKNPSQRVHIGDYVEVSSQQEWIDLVSRDSSYDKTYLFLNTSVTLLTLFYVMTWNNSRASLILGGLVYLVCFLMLISSGAMLTASIIEVEESELVVANLVVHLTNDTQITTLTTANEVGKMLKKQVYCDTVDYHTNILRHCQMYAIKLTAIVVSFTNAILAIYLIFAFFSKDYPTEGYEGQPGQAISPVVIGDVGVSGQEFRKQVTSSMSSTQERKDRRRSTDKSLKQEDIQEALNQFKRHVYGTNEEQWGNREGNKQTYPYYQPQIGKSKYEDDSDY